MPRIALGISYDGSRYHGWQYQDNVPSVQHCLEQSLSKVACSSIQVVCAGRTDAGVHALQQVVHFDCEVLRELKAWVWGTNTYLPADIAVHFAKEVPNEFHARFKALKRRYQYIIYNNPIRPAVFHQTMTWHFRHLNEDAMARAAKYFLGEHDFSSFRGPDCQSRTPNREVFDLQVYRKNQFVIVDITANSFLHHMVRNMVGVLSVIGEGKKQPIFAKEVLEAKSRQAASHTASPNGLYLVDVSYPEKYNLPKAASNLIWSN